MSDQAAPGDVIQRLSADEREAFRRHLLRLDPESRHDRFHGGASDEFLDQYADHCFAPRDVVFGAFIDGQLRGAGELRPIVADPADEFSHGEAGHAEAAFSIERPYRGRGLGARLFQQLILAAQAEQIVEIDFTCGADNKAMQSLARKFEAELRFHADHVTGRLKARKAPGSGARPAGSALATEPLAPASTRRPQA
ncbi:MAG TPA: GNAT family N-acetyltransferase [Roseiarcus sp.]|nr:GNAT family N-acetyltransferase [Roseiarcus sp.]